MSIRLEQSTGFRAIAEYMHRPTDAPTISLRELMNRHRFRPQDPRTLGHISRRWSASHGSQVINIIQYNTYLMDVTINIFSVLDEILPARDWCGTLLGSVLGTVFFGPAGALGGALIGVSVDAAREALEHSKNSLRNYRITKPACLERADELGTLIGGSRLDLAVLCEVWNTDLAQRISSRAGNLPYQQAHPEAGLLTISTLPIIDTQFHAFRAKGKANMDSDWYASKGIMLTRLETGVGVLDLYSTHLYWGDEIPEILFLTSSPSDDERTEIRRNELQEIATFITDTHINSHVAILVGDFNIDANGHPTYGLHSDLSYTMESLGFLDIWNQQFGIASADGSTQVGGHERIDYLFLESPMESHAFIIDVTKISLCDYPREVATDNQVTLSDHRALLYSILCSKE